MLRGFNNIKGKVILDGDVEKARCYRQMKEAYQLQGRLSVCDCEGNIIQNYKLSNIILFVRLLSIPKKSITVRGLVGQPCL